MGTVAVTSSDISTPGSGQTIATITRTYSASDGRGNTATHVQTITVQVTEAPVLPSAITSLTNVSVDCAALAALEGEMATDACAGEIAVTSSDTSMRIDANTEQVTRTYSAADTRGNTATHVQTITVTTTDAPFWTSFPSDVSIQCANPCPASWPAPEAANSCGTAVTAEVTSALNDGTPVAGVTTSGGTFPLGTTVVTFQAAAAYGPSATRTLTVFNGNTPPSEEPVSATLTGTNPNGTPNTNAEVTFDQVVSGGSTTVTVASGPCPTDTFSVKYGTALIGSCYDIDTSATFSGGVLVCLRYPTWIAEGSRGCADCC